MPEIVSIARAGVFALVGSITDSEGKALQLLERDGKAFVYAPNPGGFLSLLAFNTWREMERAKVPAFTLRGAHGPRLSQPALFDLQHDRRPDHQRSAAARYREPTLFDADARP